MKVFILDDEKSSRENIKFFLRDSILSPEQIQEASSVKEGFEILSSFDPDVMFLDINLNDGLSFDLLLRLGVDKRKAKIVFISAYDSYAVKAFRFNAVDYILKPINPKEFEEVLEKIDLTETEDQSQIEGLMNAFNGKKNELSKLALRDQYAIHLVEINDIIHCKSENNYTLFKLKDGKELLISKTLKEYENLLKSEGFFRPHKSTLINLRHVSKYDKRDGGFIIMADQSVVPLSRFKKDFFMKIVRSM